MSILKVKDTKGNIIDIPSIRGYSAYQLAVASGFEGTEEEWLESLKGDSYVLTEADKIEIASMSVPQTTITFNSTGNVYLRLFDCIIDGVYYPFRTINAIHNNLVVRCKFFAIGSTYEYTSVTIEGSAWSILGTELTTDNFAANKSHLHFASSNTTFTFA